ncbi:hypothetical protein [Nostoc punctiforme]|uniref:Uncharacterized protein n=1 Tax=Nostoc punctiforme (strain ATCC 29133 / PCC 73102) TaxID=63737 RepID=B2JBZ8_NOSP7|nr:hypothetical protein [Nostoc punctiforme]ACC85452.1 hypothetical protein Npun_DF032 [Nostoc punctiforme PCC 73102]
MQTFQLIEDFEFLQKLLEKDENKLVFEWLFFLADSEINEILKSIGDSIDEGNKGSVGSAQLYTRSLINQIKLRIKPKVFFSSFEILQKDYISFLKTINPNSEIESYIRSQFSLLEEAYERFIDNYDYNSTVNLITCAKVLVNILSTFNEVNSFLIKNLQQTYDFELDETLNSFSLFIDSDYTFKEFIQKLEAIQALYSELCFLYDISEVDFPLRIIKIESGSLWVKIFGESRVIETIVSLIKDAKEYGYRNLTKEGKIEAEQQNFKAIESALELRKKLQEANIDVEEFDEKIKKSSIVIINNLNTLLSGEKKIKLNGELIESDDTTQKLLKGSNRYLLEGSKDATEDNE